MKALRWLGVLLVLISAGLNAMETIHLPVSEQTELQFPNLRYAAVDQSGIIEIKQVSNILRIKALRRGQVVLHVWQQAKDRSSFVVEVTPPQASVAAASDSQAARPLKLQYQSQWGYGNSQSALEQNRYDYHWGYHLLGAQADTALGYNSSAAQIEYQNGAAAVDYANSTFYGDKTQVSLGDQDLVLSPLSVPYLSFQGSTLRYQAADNMQVSVLGGVSAKKWWGGSVLNQGPLRHSFGGAAALWGSKNDSHLELSVLQGELENISSQDVIESRRPLSNLRLSGAYALPTGVLLNAEAASDGSNLASLAGLRFGGKQLQVDAQYKMVPAGFRSFSQYFGLDGTQGLFASARLFMNAELTAQAVFNHYNHTQFSDQSSVYANTDALIGIDYRPLGVVHVSSLLWNHERRSNSGDGQHQGARLQADYPFNAERSVFAYLRYNPTWYTDGTAVSNNESIWRLAGGIEFNLAGLANLTLEREEMGSSLSGRSANNSVRLYTPALYLFASPWYVSCHLTASSQDFVSSSSRSTILGGFETGLQWSTGRKLFAMVERVGVDGLDSDGTDKGIDRYQYGVLMDLDTPVALARATGTLVVQAYCDDNGNGSYDADEPAVEGIKLTVLPANQIQTTNREGLSTFADVRAGDTAVILDARTTPLDTVYLESTERHVLVPAHGRAELTLRFAPRRTHVLTLLWDHNADGIRSEGDEVLAGIKIIDETSSKLYYSNRLGEIYLTDAEAAKATLLVDVDSLPKEMQKVNVRKVLNAQTATKLKLEWVLR